MKINYQKKLFLILLFFVTSLNLIFSQQIWTIGPMVHFNFGVEKPTVSYGIEGAYWNFDHFFHSVDAGIEFERSKIRIYSELQTGIVLAGIGCGPLLEINTSERSAHMGVQGSLWLNCFLGFDCRLRKVGNNNSIGCFGLYGKVPFTSNGIYNSDEYHHHHHHHDWDD